VLLARTRGEKDSSTSRCSPTRRFLAAVLDELRLQVGRTMMEIRAMVIPCRRTSTVDSSGGGRRLTYESGTVDWQGGLQSAASQGSVIWRERGWCGGVIGGGDLTLIGIRELAPQRDWRRLRTWERPRVRKRRARPGSGRHQIARGDAWERATLVSQVCTE
jgi:hypothetical protein